MTKVYDLAEIIEQTKERTDGISIAIGKETVTVPPPILWPDEVFESSDQNGARLLLGEHYDAFVAAGGTARLLFDIIKRSQGATVPE